MRMSTELYNQTLTILTDLDSGSENAQVFARMAGLEIPQINFQGSALNVYDSMLSVAERDRKILDLVAAFLKVHNRNQNLIDLKSTLSSTSYSNNRKSFPEAGQDWEKASIFVVGNPADAKMPLSMELMSQLQVLTMGRNLTIVGMDLELGAHKAQGLEKRLSEANILLLLITSRFFHAVPDCVALARLGSDKGKDIIPVILENCPWSRIRLIADIQVLPRSEIPLSESSNRSKGAAEVAAEIDRFLVSKGVK